MKLDARDAERAVLGVMLQHASAVPEAAACLLPGSFGAEAHAAVFKAVLALHARGSRADLVTTTAELERTDTLVLAGGREGVAGLIESAGALANLPTHARLVLEAAARRRVCKRALELHERAVAGVDLADLAAFIEAEAQVVHSVLTGRRGGTVVTPLCDVERERVEWLWQHRVPFGAVTVLDGDPGLGKSTVAFELAARLSNGSHMPDGTPGPEAGKAILLSAEDDRARTIRPRLEAAGADLSRVLMFDVREGDAVRDPMLTPGDLSRIETVVKTAGVRLLVVDPLMAFLPSEVDSHRDQDVRRVLAALRSLAERTLCAVVLVRHLNKRAGGNALYRGGGSVGIIGAARAGLLLAPDPEDSRARILAPTKSNLGPEPPALRLRVVADGETVRIEWEGQTEHTASGLLAAADSERGHAKDTVGLHDRAATALRKRVESWAATGDPMRKNKDAIPFLIDRGVSRDGARVLIRERDGLDWQLSGGGKRSDPEVLLPCADESPQETSARSASVQTPRHSELSENSIPAERMDNGPQETGRSKSTREAASTPAADSCGNSETHRANRLDTATVRRAEAVFDRTEQAELAAGADPVTATDRARSAAKAVLRGGGFD